MENYITHLYVQNTGVFEKLNISFNRGFNFIVGPNGSGKTSILKCIALSLAPYNASGLRYGEESALWFDAIYNDQNYRIGLGQGWVSNVDIYRAANFNTWVNPPANEVGVKTFNAYNLGKSEINITPLFLGAYRRIEYRRIEGMRRESNVAEQRNSYRSLGLASLEGGSLPEIKQWLINRYFQMEKDWASVYKRNWEWILQNLSNLGPTNCSLEFKYIKRDLEPMFILQGTECYLEEVSAGFQAILSLVFAIVEWIEGTNDEDRAYIPEATGTVVIDELDVHLHPEWQLTIRKSLATIFPRLQFIITTHSPHLIATAGSGELIVLPELKRSICVEPITKVFSGWSTDQILEEIMCVKNLDNKMHTIMIEKAMRYVKEKNIQALVETISELQHIVHPSSTILQVLQVKLAEMELGDTYDKN